MANSDKMLSKDPIGAFEQINGNYLRYFKTMYRLRDTNLDQEKNSLLNQDNNLYREPYCEVIPKYESTNQTLGALCQNWHCSLNLPRGYSDFISKGLMDYPLYRHQYEMLCNGYGEEKNVLITSGTGSGKTESFMLPLLASLLNEAQTWNKPCYIPQWWRTRDDAGRYIYSQRIGENRPAALRSLLLYPMNALVADQVARLRKSLDSDDVREYLDRHADGNRIFFGSYNGNTPKAVKLSTAELLDDYFERSKQLQKNAVEPDDIYVLPRLSDNNVIGEMIVREDMQVCPPDIMITNISMLSIMLMRVEEQNMLDITRDYYMNNPDAVFHVVVDELHLHRGTAGAEVAYLLRMFLDRIGVPPMVNGKRNKQLRIYASSASIANNTQQYLEDFFGVYDQNDPFIIQQGYPMPFNVDPKLSLNYNSFEVFYKNTIGKPYYEQDVNDKLLTDRQFLSSVNYTGNIQDFVREYAALIYRDIKNISSSSFPLSDLQNLPGNPSPDAIRGFLIFRGEFNNEMLPNIRFHLFFKYIDGLWGELQPDGMHQGPIGELMYQPTEVSSNGQHKVLELLRCECCGELFVGGNRKDIANGMIGMSLNDPDLDRIPNMQSTPMVQRKSIRDYVVFWPSSSHSVNGYYSKDNVNYERFGVLNMSDSRTNADNGINECHGAWREAYLNPYDGTISFAVTPITRSEYIHGYIYAPRNVAGQNRVTLSNQDLKALPCKCPHCDKDYLWRKYTHSPIRSFRTGMGRNNQILSKELLYQIPSYGNHDSKLIGFSDSRQDAAEQSKLIAREHYRDILRLTFINLIKSRINVQTTQPLMQLQSTVEVLLTNGYDASTVVSQSQQVSRSDRDAILKILGSSSTLQQKILDIKSYVPRWDVMDLCELISLPGTNNINGELVSELLKLGVNPAGSEYADKYPLNSQTYWDQLYDFNANIMRPLSAQQLTPSGNTLFVQVYERLQANIFNNCFGQYMNVNTESAGLGYVMPEQSPNVSTLENLIGSYLAANNLNMEDFLSALIRVYGDCYRFDGGDYETKPMRNYREFKSQIKKFVVAVANQANLAEDVLGNQINLAMQEAATDSDGKLNLYSHALRFKLTHSNDDYYQCDHCGRVHLHRGAGICTNMSCCQKLPTNPTGKVDSLWRDNYISHDVMVLDRMPRRLHPEELTGQTDNQTERLLQFKDIILDQCAERKANIVDMLNVTTTMEVGVDIGSLQAIYQGNMPPTRYNYQQRVGRAGRRNQAFSVAVTFCRGRSHDNYYYYNAIDQMTGSAPPDPSISVKPIVGQSSNLVIIKRVILKHILMLISASKADWAICDGTSGQLGGSKSTKGDWTNDVMPEIRNWISTNDSLINSIVHYYLDQYILPHSKIFDEIIDWINNDAVNEMDKVIDGKLVEDNARVIAEAGILPLYGMPTTIRNMYHSGYTDSYNQLKEVYNGIIDRPLEMAISEFAPGAVKTKDGAEYVSAGLTIPIDSCSRFDSNEIHKVSEYLDPLQFSYNITLNGNDIVDISNYSAHAVDRVNTFRLVVPKAFRTYNILGNMGTTNQEDDSRTNYMPISIWVNAQSQNLNSISDGAMMWESWNGSRGRGDVWYINFNNARMFSGNYAFNTKHVNLKGRRSWRTSEPIYFKEEVNRQNLPVLLDNAPNFMIGDLGRSWVSGGSDSIAIGAKKITDILCLTLNPQLIPACLCLNPTSYGGRNKSAIIAAFYSAATLIQRTYADLIDIAPEEIEISEVKIDSVTGMPRVYMNDAASNGAGFISLLTSVDPATNNLRLLDVMKEIVSPNPSSRFILSLHTHSSECSTSCPKCLNTFYNRSLHHVLDWRLGMDLIQLMLDSNYKMGYDNLSNTPYKDFAGLLNSLGNRVQRAHPQGNVVYHANNGLDWRTGYFESRMMGGVLAKEYLVHPLWNIDVEEYNAGYEPQSLFCLQRNVKNVPVESTIQVSIPKQPSSTPTVTSGVCDSSTISSGSKFGSLG